MADLEEAGIRLVAEGQEAFEGVLAGVGNVVSGFGSLVMDVASEVGAAFVEFFQDSFAGALEAEQTIARLGQVIESTGGIAGVTIGEAEDLADEFKHLAGGSDDAVLSIIDMGLRMGTISEEEMPAFIQTTLDLGTVMGDASKAAMVLARAQEDPIGTLGALRKAGILVSEEMEAQMKAMVATGDTAGAYSLLMDRVGEATAGAAETMALTTAGQWAVFQETIADAGETIVGSLLGPLNTLMQTYLIPLMPLVEQVAGAIAIFFETILGGGDVNTAFDNLAGAIYRAFGPEAGLAVMQFGDFVSGIVATIQENLPLAQAKFDEVMTSIQPVIDAAGRLAASFVESMPMIQTKVGEMVTFVQEQFAIFGPPIIANVTKTLDEMKKFWDEHGDEVMEIVKVALELVSSTVGGLIVVISGVVAAGMQILNGDWTGAWETVKETARAFMEGVLTLVDTDLDGFIESWRGTFTLLGDIITLGWQGATTFITDGITAAIAAAQAIVDGTLALGQAFIDNIANGITGAIAGLINAAVAAAQAAYAAILEELGIHSPSPLLMDVGATVDESLALGMLRNIREVVEAASMVGQAAMVRPPMSAGQIGAQYAYSNTDARQYNLNVTTDKRMATVGTEFSTMQVLAGLT